MNRPCGQNKGSQCTECSQNSVCVQEGPAIVTASPWGHLLLPLPPSLQESNKGIPEEGYSGALGNEWELITENSLVKTQR